MKIFIGIFFALVLIIFKSKIKINIQSLNKQRKSFKIHFNVTIELCLLGLINIKLINFQETGIYFLFFKIPYEKINMPKYNMKILKEKSIGNIIKNLNLRFEKINFKMLIGTQNVMLNAFFVSFISATFAIISGKYNKKINTKRYYYEIIPMYNSNMLEFNLQTLLSINIINIIRTVIFATKNGKSENQKLYKEILVKI